ncbi:MAG: glutamine--fructose-6-phosphate transaminase (isomerizing) [Pseudomonadales bacterium]|jgi:glucosamine--fructose-6-phosphate aminotransferase (isomerizing)|nr:glutamine--fructose-6-phosphate transaminase (isomerizing) [Pseudomonadales bacterium]
MCGIVGAVAHRPVSDILITGLKRLEYRGYDSAGVAVVGPGADGTGTAIAVRKTVGKVAALEAALDAAPLAGTTGIAHTRWATHGVPSETNAHPHVSHDCIALVHNGIIENYEALREKLRDLGYEFRSETDSETVVHLVHHHFAATGNLAEALRHTVKELEGAFSLSVIHRDAPDRLVAARKGSPLVVGVGIGEHYIASDVLALRAVTDRFIFLEEGDLVELTREGVSIFNMDDLAVVRATVRVEMGAEDTDKGNYRHHMLKEIHQQPLVIRQTLEGRLSKEHVLEQCLGLRAKEILDAVRAVTIVGCGSAYYTGAVARYWIEALAGIPCNVEIASEYRYREAAVLPGTLFVTISQSGETADTLAALRLAKEKEVLATLTVCNVPTSSIVRESDLALMLEAGPEIGVASTKAFTAQLTDLLLLAVLLGRRGTMSEAREREIVAALHDLPASMQAVLALEDRLETIAEDFIDKHHALFLGRGEVYPIALEGALKLKEISYIHAEGYPAGELKHGPLALVDSDMPVIAVAPNDDLLEKLQSNLHEVRARGGQLYVFADEAVRFKEEDDVTVIPVPPVSPWVAPMIHTVPLQLLAYHVAVLRGTDVDQPRNLAKSVTVE